MEYGLNILWNQMTSIVSNEGQPQNNILKEIKTIQIKTITKTMNQQFQSKNSKKFFSVYVITFCQKL